MGRHATLTAEPGLQLQTSFIHCFARGRNREINDPDQWNFAVETLLDKIQHADRLLRSGRQVSRVVSIHQKKTQIRGFSSQNLLETAPYPAILIHVPRTQAPESP